MSRSVRTALCVGSLVFAAAFAVTVRTTASPAAVALFPATAQGDRSAQGRPGSDDGQTIFRFDTFADEQLWTNVLRMQEAIRSVSPATALAVGLKVDVEALPPALIAALQAKQVDLTDPAVT